MGKVSLTQSLTGLEINPILEITVFIWKVGSGHFLGHIWKLASVLYEDMLTIDKTGTGSGLQTSVRACAGLLIFDQQVMLKLFLFLLQYLM